MIPRFNKHGYLPHGIHRATLYEIEKRFGSGSSKRKGLCKKLKSFVKLLRKHKKDIKRFLLNGSFVTDKKMPGDLDCVLVVKECFDFGSPEAKKLKYAKRLYDTHLFVFMESDGVQSRKLMDFFGHDRENKMKGFMEVVL